MMLVYAIQYLDKSTKSTAGSSRRPEDGRRRLCAFYIGYLIFEFLSVYILQHFPLVKTVSVFIILWGLVLCLQAASNYPGFIALRAILGMLESAVTLCFVILTSPWCKREEQFLRTSIWLGANELGLMVGSFMAYGQAANPPLTIAGWRLIFIITGVFTVVVSIIGTTEFVGCILFGIIVHYFQSRLFMSLVAQLIGFMATCLLTSGDSNTVNAILLIGDCLGNII
ncbi:uncharacterized protein YALI1_A14596g [Yarrowia lipolytica]|uniref:Major facilitator superfamily domain-containing protein n=1 Tax=Yarrowia lipolytica TaxID=4952 RepID=A0A1D8N4V2_YARLL|nr:hypothetical protein YALI1_A14596g [Yarrowia lipolytica]